MSLKTSKRLCWLCMYDDDSIDRSIGWANGKHTNCWTTKKPRKRHDGKKERRNEQVVKSQCPQKLSIGKETPVGKILGQEFCFHFTSFCFWVLDVSWDWSIRSLDQRYNSTTNEMEKKSATLVNFGNWFIVFFVCACGRINFLVHNFYTDFFFFVRLISPWL